MSQCLLLNSQVWGVAVWCLYLIYDSGSRPEDADIHAKCCVPVSASIVSCLLCPRCALGYMGSGCWDYIHGGTKQLNCFLPAVFQVRIGGGVYPDSIKEADYLNKVRAS